MKKQNNQERRIATVPMSTGIFYSVPILIVHLIVLPSMISGLSGCNSKNQQHEENVAIDSVAVADTVDHSSDFLADSVFEWQVQVKNGWSNFSSISILKDGSFITCLRADNEHQNSLPNSLLDEEQVYLQLFIAVAVALTLLGNRSWCGTFNRGELFNLLRRCPAL